MFFVISWSSVLFLVCFLVLFVFCFLFLCFLLFPGPPFCFWSVFWSFSSFVFCSYVFCYFLVLRSVSGLFFGPFRLLFFVLMFFVISWSSVLFLVCFLVLFVFCFLFLCFLLFPGPPFCFWSVFWSFS